MGGVVGESVEHFSVIPGLLFQQKELLRSPFSVLPNSCPEPTAALTPFLFPDTFLQVYPYSRRSGPPRPDLRETDAYGNQLLILEKGF